MDDGAGAEDSAACPRDEQAERRSAQIADDDDVPGDGSHSLEQLDDAVGLRNMMQKKAAGHNVEI